MRVKEVWHLLGRTQDLREEAVRAEGVGKDATVSGASRQSPRRGETREG